MSTHTEILANEIEALCLRIDIPFSEDMFILAITVVKEKKEKKEKDKDK